jgi:phospholipid/cholesterol/gamma-HCH transport system substrate-binding protein
MPTEQEAEAEGRSVTLMLVAAGGLLAVLAAILIGVSGLSIFNHRLTATTYFTNAVGLKSGAAVNLNGVAIGVVKSVTITTDPKRQKTPVQVVMKIERKYQTEVRADSLAELSSLGALADTVIDIDSEQANGPPMPDFAELKTLNTPSVLDLAAGQDTVRRLNETETRFNTVVDQMTSGKGTLGKIMSDPDLMKKVNATSDAVARVTVKLDNKNSTAGKLLNGHDVTDKLAALGTDIQGVSASYSKLANGPLQANLTSVGNHATSLTNGLNNGEGAAGMLMKNPKQLTDTLSKANALLSDYSKNPKTGGNFTAGGETAVDLKKLSAKANELSTLIRSNPKKYLTIQVRVF